MKKLLLITTLLVVFNGNAQTVLFEENWDSVGPGILGWTLYNVDGLTPVAAATAGGGALSNLVQDAWNVLSTDDIEGATPGGSTYPAAATGIDNIIACNSWYEPVGIANDWLVSPTIAIPAGSTAVNLKWAALSRGSASYLEDYKVYVSPTGGDQVADFTVLLQNVPNELSTGSYRTKSLNAYAGTTIRVAFRADGNDQYVMFLDNINVTATLPLSSNSFGLDTFSVTPNPANDFVNISNSKNNKISEISITDINGRQVKNLKFNNVTETKCNVSDLNSGVYFITINTDNGKAIKKFIKI